MRTGRLGASEAKPDPRTARFMACRERETRVTQTSESGAAAEPLRDAGGGRILSAAVDPATLEPGSPAELAAFADLQSGLAPMYQQVFSDPAAPRTVVVIPSLSLDASELQKIDGVDHYEERLLCLLMLLRLPRTHIVYVTSRALAPPIIDYYLHLLPGVPASHARRRLTLLTCDDGSLRPLTEKILYRPRLIERIRAAIDYPASSHITCFNSTALERTLAVRLGIPMYATDPALAFLGTKTGSRRVFREAGIDLPDGSEGVRTRRDVAQELAALAARNPSVRRVLVKLDEGFSGEGNATFDLRRAPETGVEQWIYDQLPVALQFEARGETWPSFEAKLETMGGIVECFVDGAGAMSPSVQCRIDPVGDIEIVSTHDQVLGGPTGQIFLGCRFPANEEYRASLHDAGRRVGAVLRDKGVIGRYAVDFVSVRHGDRWSNYAIEINLRKGGTTLPFLMLQFLTNGTYHPETGHYLTAMGEPRFYYATDNLQRDDYRRLTPRDLIDVVVEKGLHFDSTTQEGVVFHLIGAIAEWGKLGALAIGRTRRAAEARYDRTVEVLDREAAAARS